MHMHHRDGRPLRIKRHMAWQIAIMVAIFGIWSLIVAAVSEASPRLAPVLTGIIVAVMAMNARRFIVRMSWPIERLIHASRRFGAGDLATRVEMPPWWQRHRELWLKHRHHRHRHGGPLELFELTEAWNDMAGRIESLVRGQRELLANVSHELRSPLARVRVALDLLPRTPETERRFADVVADLEELDRLIDDVLTAARLEGGAMPLRRGDVDLVELLGSIRERAEHDPLVAGKTVEVRAVPEALP